MVHPQKCALFELIYVSMFFTVVSADMLTQSHTRGSHVLSLAVLTTQVIGVFLRFVHLDLNWIGDYEFPQLFQFN